MKGLDGQPISTPSTPTKRKREGDVKTPTKRTKASVKQENHDGEPFSDVSSSPSSQELKAEEEQKESFDSYRVAEAFSLPADPADFFQPSYGQINPESSMASSSTGSSYASGSYYG